LGAAVVIYPDNIWYTRVSVNDVDEIFKTSILKNGVVKRLVATKNTWNELQMIRESNQ
jgi:(2Fe-2S) ferredoxin